MSPQLEDIVRKVRSDERIAPAEALVLWHEAPLWLLGELAARLGGRSKARAVGGAAHANPVAIIVPCHRLIGANGSLTGFGGGLPLKQALLDLERDHPGPERRP